MSVKQLIYLIGFKILILSFTQTIYAQSFFPERNGIIFKNETKFDAVAITDTWFEVEGNQEIFSKNLNTAFQSGLTSDGIIIDPDAPNFLICTVSVAQANSTVFYTYDVKYYLYNTEGLNILLWTAGGISLGESRRLTADLAAKDCVDTFSNEWLKQNPKQ